MAVGLRALNKVASSSAIDRLGLRDPAVRLLQQASKTTGRTAARAGRTFAAAQRLSRPARQPRTGSQRPVRPRAHRRAADAARLGPRVRARRAPPGGASAADADCAAPPELLGQANELGLTMVGVPEELGGAVEERSAATTVLMSEALAQGDMGIAVACLAPAAVSTALSLWGDAQQQATYLPDVRRRGRARRRARGDGAPAAVQPVRAADQGPPGRAAATCSTASRRWSRAPATASCSWSRPSSRARARRCSSSNRRPRGITRRARPRDGDPRRRHRQADPR